LARKVQAKERHWFWKIITESLRNEYFGQWISESRFRSAVSFSDTQWNISYVSWGIAFTIAVICYKKQ
jgi:hypothetical protein